jgi:hypothetical protein
MYYYNGYYMSGYSDFYNYGRYEGQVPGPNNVAGFTFYGPGPEIITYNNLRRLGYTNKKTKVGRPYQLKVISDDTDDICGVKDRKIVFQVVDVNGRGTGKTRVVESFFDKQYGTPMATAYNSCRQQEFAPIGCDPTDLPNGKFTDHLSVQCPMVEGDCGFPELLSRWSWCPVNGDLVTLTTNTYYARRDVILVNGSPKLQLNTFLH